MKEKACSECGLLKPLSEFYTQNKYSKKRGNYIYYRPDCKECASEKAMRWQKDNHSKYNRWQQKYSQTENGKRLHRKAQKNYRDLGKQTDWQRNNVDKIKKYNENRNHKNHNITEEEWNQCKKYFDYECAYCGISEKEHIKQFKQQLHKEHVDHEGSNELDNCIPSCKSCNSSKHTSILEEWYFREFNREFASNRLNKIYKWLNEDYLKFKS